MHARRLLRALPAAAAVLAASVVVTGCGGELPESNVTKVDPSKAEAVLRSYLDDDRCDLLSDRMAQQIAVDPEAGRQLCDTQGQLPVDAYVRPGQYKVTSREVIDGDGIFTIELRDGGTRDYTLTPGGSDGFQIDSVVKHSEAEIGQPLRLQARLTPAGALVDARITVTKLRRLKDKDLSADEFVSSLNHYYVVTVRVRNMTDKPIEVGSLGFSLAQKNDVAVGQPQPPFSEIGRALPTEVPPNATVRGNLFFAIPSETIARPSQVWFTMGSDATGAKLVWKK